MNSKERTKDADFARGVLFFMLKESFWRASSLRSAPTDGQRVAKENKCRYGKRDGAMV